MSSLKSFSPWISTYLPLANVIACLIYLIRAELAMAKICALLILIQGVLMFLAFHFVPTRLKWETKEVADKALQLRNCNDHCIIITNVAMLVLAVTIAAGFLISPWVWLTKIAAGLMIFLNLAYLFVLSEIPSRWERNAFNGSQTPDFDTLL